MSRLAVIECSLCRQPYVWRSMFHAADDRQTWRPVPDCNCVGAFGQPGDPVFIRHEYVVIERDPHGYPDQHDVEALVAAQRVSDDDDDTPVVDHGYHDEYVEGCVLCEHRGRR